MFHIEDLFVEVTARKDRSGWNRTLELDLVIIISENSTQLPVSAVIYVMFSTPITVELNSESTRGGFTPTCRSPASHCCYLWGSE